MNKVGYIAKIKSKGKEYFYLRKSMRKSDLVEKKSIYSFGSRESAIEKLIIWEKDMSEFPVQLKELGYDVDDVFLWKEQIKSK